MQTIAESLNDAKAESERPWYKAAALPWGDPISVGQEGMELKDLTRRVVVDVVQI